MFTYLMLLIIFQFVLLQWRCLLYFPIVFVSVSVEKKAAKSEVDEAIADLMNWTQQTKVRAKQLTTFKILKCTHLFVHQSI